MRERNYGIKFAALVGGIVFLTFFAGIHMNGEAKEIRSEEREAFVKFKGAYEKKEEDKKGDETKKKEKEKENTAESQPVVTEGAAASVPESLPQTGEAGGDAGMGILTGGMLLAECLLKKY